MIEPLYIDVNDPVWKAFVSNVVLDPVTGCWLWQGPVNPVNGYSQFHPAKGRAMTGHQFAFEKIRGPVPDDLELHHNECQNRLCVNAFHVEPIAHSAHQALHRAELCRKGLHPMDGDNLVIRPTPGRSPLRSCRQCGRDRALARYHRIQNERKGGTATRRSA